MKPLQQLANCFAENRINHIHFKNKSSQSNGPINAYCKLKERPFTANSCLPQYTGWKTKRFTIKINNSDNCVIIKNGSLVLLENIATSKTDNKILGPGHTTAVPPRGLNRAVSPLIKNPYLFTERVTLPRFRRVATLVAAPNRDMSRFVCFAASNIFNRL